jgi:hypothetical protein
MARERGRDVQFPGVVRRVEPEPFRLLGPDAADELVGGEPAQRLEAAGVIVGIQEELQMGAQLVVAGVVIAAHGRVLEGAVHPLDLTVGPGVVGLGQPVLDPVPLAGVVEGMDAPEAGLAAGGPDGVDRGLGLGVVVDRQGVGELGAVVGQHRVHLVGHGPGEGVQEVGRDPARGPLVQLGEGEL